MLNFKDCGVIYPKILSQQNPWLCLVDYFSCMFLFIYQSRCRKHTILGFDSLFSQLTFLKLILLFNSSNSSHPKKKIVKLFLYSLSALLAIGTQSKDRKKLQLTNLLISQRRTEVRFFKLIPTVFICDYLVNITFLFLFLVLNISVFIVLCFCQ